MEARKETIYAIGFGGSVEIRACKRAPRPIRSIHEKDGTRTMIQCYEDKRGRLRHRKVQVPHKFTLNTTIHSGGKVLKTLNSDAFWRLTHLTIPYGKSLRLNTRQAAVVLAKGI